MMNLRKAVTAVAFATVLVVPAAALFAAGSHDHGHEAVEYDPVENEFGKYEPDMKVTKKVKVVMSDSMTFTPNMIKVKKGDVIQFTHKNEGKLMHEFVLGTKVSLDEHAEMMKKFPNMEHEEPYMAHVAPGKTATITWKFSEEGEFAFGCLVPGHYDAGMKGSVVVES